MGLDLYVFPDAGSANRLLADRNNPSLSNRYHTNCPARSPEASLGQAGGGFRSTCTAPQYSGEQVTYLLFSRGVCVGEVAGLAVDLAALQAKAQQLDQAMQGAALCKAASPAARGGTPPPPPVVEGGTTPVMPEIPEAGGGSTPAAPPIGVPGSPSAASSPAGTSTVPTEPGGEEEWPPWLPLAAALGGGALGNLLGRALGRALSGQGEGAEVAPLGAPVVPGGDGGDGSAEPPPDQQKQETYRVVLSPAVVSLRGDGVDSAVLIPQVVSSDGRDVTAESVFRFEKLSDIGDAAAVLAPGAAAATLFARLLLTGDSPQFAVRCIATVPTSTGPVVVESDAVSVTVRPANPQFTVQLPADGGIGSGDGTIAVSTTLTVFGESRTDYQVTFACSPPLVSGIFNPGPGQATALPVPKLVVAAKNYTVSAKGTYLIGATEVPLQDAKSITFTPLAPELCVTPSKDTVTGDGQDAATLAISGVFGANGQAFTPLMISVDPPRLGGCPSPAAGTSTTSFVAPQLDGSQDEDVAITVRAKYAGDDGEIDLTGQTVLTVLALAPQLSIETDADDVITLANGGNQIILHAVLRLRGQAQPATETTWEIAPTIVDGQSRVYGTLQGSGATVPYRVPQLVATPSLSQTIKARYRGQGLDLTAETVLALDGMRPKIEVRLEPDTDPVHADGKRYDIAAEAYWEAYNEGGEHIRFLPKDLQYSLVDGDGSVTPKDEWTGSYQAPDSGSDAHDDVTVVVRASGRVIGDDAPAPGIEIHGDARFTLRYPNPGCRVQVTPASVTADGKSIATVTVVPLLYGVDARSQGATVTDFAVPLSIPDLGRVSGLDRTALTAALTIFRLTNSFSLSVPGDVMVSLDGKLYHCQGAGLLQVTGEEPELHLRWQAEDGQEAVRGTVAGDANCWVRVTAEAGAYGGGQAMGLGKVSFTATLSGAPVVMERVDATTVRLQLGLLLKEGTLDVQAQAAAQDYPLSASLSIPVGASTLSLVEPTGDCSFDIFAKHAWLKQALTRAGALWYGTATARLSAGQGDAAMPIKWRKIAIVYQAFLNDAPGTDEPRTIWDAGERTTEAEGTVHTQLQHWKLLDAMQAWTERPPGITLCVNASASDDYGNTASAIAVIRMRKPTALTLTMPERIEEHVGGKVAVQGDPLLDAAKPSYRWTLIALDEQWQRQAIDVPDTEWAAELDFAVDNYRLRETLHNIPLAIRQDDPLLGSVARGDRLDAKALHLQPLAEALNQDDEVIASSSPGDSFRRLVWQDWCRSAESGVDERGTCWYLLRNPLLFIHGILGSILMRGDEMIFPAPVEYQATSESRRHGLDGASTWSNIGDIVELLTEPAAIAALARLWAGTQGIPVVGKEVHVGLPLGRELESDSAPPMLEPAPTSTDGVRPVGLIHYVPPTKECYLGLLRFLEKLQYAPPDTATNPRTPPHPSKALGLMYYDWRLDNRRHEPRVKLFIDTLLNDYYGDIDFQHKEDRRVILLVHSMGGLITRYYHAMNQQHFDDNIACWITLGTPHQGAAEPLLASLAGMQTNGLVETVLNQSPDAGLEMASRMPSNHQLLAFFQPILRIHMPDGTVTRPLMVTEVETAIRDAHRMVYDQAKKDYPDILIRPSPEELQVFRSQQVLDDARVFHEEISRVAPPRLIHFAGMNRKVLNCLDLRFEVKTEGVELLQVHINLVWEVKNYETCNGDGTVPKWGLQLSPMQQDGCLRWYKVMLTGDYVHRSLGSEPDIQDALTQIIRGALPSGDTLG
ncbi:hypothetical protein QU487_20385 [Crenobacter sp. SG2305]|uniref:lipase/acyltransferase domain-containing protein n=1 Tax=Crenobacter oryzisoli TaxID=3056844 RepID=UPI0025AB36AE|nr:hypothetical protein [Crenobacter sp. SG2305]MDN0085069.1 hypothetical protein [Crenobacter sp. SG2305]